MDTKFIGKNTWIEHPEYERGFKAGQQSKQAEIDELNRKIDRIRKLSEGWHRSSGSALALKVLELLK